MRTCNVCGESLPLEAFHRDRTKPEGRDYTCRPCTRRQQQRRFEARKEYLRSLKDGPCADCGQRFHFSAMQWDHRPGTDKKFQLSRAHHRPDEEIEAELAKCDLVCANCHAVRTWTRMQEAA